MKHSLDHLADDSQDMMRDGWILEHDGSIHAARTLAMAVLPCPNGMLLRLNYAMTEEQARLGMVQMVQVALSESQVASLAVELLDYRNDRRQ